MYLTLKLVHMSCAMLTIAGFLVRGYWMMTDSALLQNRATKIAPHIIDTLFLLSGVAIIYVLNIQVMAQPWLLAKFAGLIVYIALGVIALRPGRSAQIRAIAFVAAVSVFAYIVGVAVTKSVTSWLAYLTI
jgi:uncharacterized membrane protein SirB2